MFRISRSDRRILNRRFADGTIDRVKELMARNLKHFNRNETDQTTLNVGFDISRKLEIIKRCLEKIKLNAHDVEAKKIALNKTNELIELVTRAGQATREVFYEKMRVQLQELYRTIYNEKFKDSF